MKTYVQDGNVIDYVAGSAISSGDVVVIGPLIGVAVDDIANGATGPVLIEGVVDMVKNVSALMPVGSRPYWDVSASELAIGLPSTGDVVGALVVIEAAASGDATATVKLTPSGSATIT